MQLFANNAASKLAAPISGTATSIQVAAGDGAKFPSPGVGEFFLVTLSKFANGIESDLEIVKVTARSGDVFTVVRGQEGTTGQIYGIDDRCELRFTAATATDTEEHKNDFDNPHAVTKSQIGLSNVDNTSDALKPISTATQTALDLKAPIDSPTFTGTVGGVTKAMVGLGNVDNTSDASKPISTATQAALDLKQGLDADLTAIAALAGTSGFLKKTAADTWALDTNTYLTGITSGMVTTALGFTPYNASNPNGYITSSASISGNAATATALATARTINGVNFDGTGNITVADATKLPLSGGTMSGLITFAAGQTFPNAGIKYTKKTAAYPAVKNDGIIADTTAGPWTLTLPATPAAGDQVFVADGGSWGTNSLTVARNGSTIEGLAENLVLNTAGAQVQLLFDGTTWQVYTQIGSVSGEVLTTTGTQTVTNKTLTTPIVNGTPSTTAGMCGYDSTANVPTYYNGTAVHQIGYLNIPQNPQSVTYGITITDAGKHILHPSTDASARTFTIPANSSVAFPIGTAITFINQNGAGTITIEITTDTMRLAGAGTTGSRTLAANGVATAIKITSTEWIISGTNLT